MHTDYIQIDQEELLYNFYLASNVSLSTDSGSVVYTYKSWQQEGSYVYKSSQQVSESIAPLIGDGENL